MADSQLSEELGELGDESQGCYVTQAFCKKRPRGMSGTFKAGDREAQEREEACLAWAARAHLKCRNPANAVTTVVFRTTGASAEYPSAPEAAFVRKRHRQLVEEELDPKMLPVGDVSSCAQSCLDSAGCRSFSFATRGMEMGNCTLSTNNQNTMTRFEW